MLAATSFGEFVKKRRLELGLTLRAFCRQNGLDVGNMSKIERGLMDPPKTRAAQDRLAQALRLREGAEEWKEFLELAAISAGRIPESVMNDEELAPKLPLLFRTLSGQPLTEKKLRELAELIRRS
jgi:transcriptional regulator with XRE-family HTH domain